MSDTPETDAAWRELRENNRVQPLLYVANKLERERDEARREQSSIQDKIEELERERDRARDTVLCLRKQRAIARSFGEQMERERNEARKALQEIASLGTSQDASPQQCAAVLLAMNALEQ
jgi:seryl-tRNA synthetase